MRLVFFNNSLNHHQIAVADALYSLLHDDFRFVATRKPADCNMKGGEDYSSREYYLCAEANAEARHEAELLAKEVDVALFGAESQHYAVLRAKYRNDGLSFEIGERWLKRGWKNLLSPVLLRWLKNYWLYYRNRPFYKLNSSAFAAKDHTRLHTYLGRCYKWGYFTEAEAPIDRSVKKTEVGLLWVGRFIDWKHPELAIQLAYRLKTSGYAFHLDMIGEGVEKIRMKQLCSKLELNDFVTLQGAKDNRQVRTAMKNHDILLVTSDSREGWGAVVNEALGSACVVVGSDAVGSIPYLVQDGVNGMIFKSADVESLFAKTITLFEKPQERIRIAQRGFETVKGLWSPQQAAVNLLQLIQDLQQGNPSSVLEGPCSKDA